MSDEQHQSDPFSLVVTDEEKNAGIRKAAADLEEFYRRHPDERPPGVRNVNP